MAGWTPFEKRAGRASVRAVRARNEVGRPLRPALHSTLLMVAQLSSAVAQGVKMPDAQQQMDLSLQNAILEKQQQDIRDKKKRKMMRKGDRRQ
jgi:hypothetical protein